MAEETPAAPPVDNTAPLAARVDGLETEQKRQGGILDRIEGLLTTSGDTTVTSADQPPAADAAGMAEQMRQAVRDVNAEAAAAAPKDAPKAPAPETTPREVMIKGKDKLQRVLFGGDPK
jgi:hypothetical protein